MDLNTANSVVLDEHHDRIAIFKIVSSSFFSNVAADYVQTCFLFIARAFGKLAFCP